MTQKHCYFTLFFFAITVLMFCSCSNTNSDKNTTKNRETIVGRWMVVSSSVKVQYYNEGNLVGTEDDDNTNDIDYMLLEFTSNGSIMVDDKYEGVYTINEDIITCHKSNEIKIDFTIEDLSDSNLVLIRKSELTISEEEDIKWVYIYRIEHKRIG